MLIIVWGSIKLNPAVVKKEGLAISFHAFNVLNHACMSLATVWSDQNRLGSECHREIQHSYEHMIWGLIKIFAVRLHLCCKIVSVVRKLRKRTIKHFWWSSWVWIAQVMKPREKTNETEIFPTRRTPGEPVSRTMVLQSSGTVKTPVTNMQKITLMLVYLQRRLQGWQQQERRT